MFTIVPNISFGLTPPVNAVLAERISRTVAEPAQVDAAALPASGPLAGADPRVEGEGIASGALDRRPQLASLLTNPGTVNRILEDTQGIDRQRRDQAEALRQASLVSDAYKRSFFISMIDPGRAMTVLGTRETTKLEET